MPGSRRPVERFALYRRHGLGVARNMAWGDLTPELIDALDRLRAFLIVNEGMDGPRIRVRFVIPGELEDAFQLALQGSSSTTPKMSL